MKTYFVKILLFTFLINTLVFPHNENCQNNHNNISFIQNNTQRTTIKSRLLAQTQKHNPHYHNDPELKEIIDKLNDEAIKKYQQTFESYEQLRELVEKNGTKLTGVNGAKPISGIEKELLETYEEMFGHKNDIMSKSGMYPNDDDKSDKSSSCECANNNNRELANTKGKDKYLKHLKHRCTRGICTCSVGSIFVIFIGLLAAKAAAAKYFEGVFEAYFSHMTIFNMFSSATLESTLKVATGGAAGASDVAGSAVSAAMGAFPPYGIAAMVLLILAVVLIILYIWLYRRRKRSLKHECKKHLCK
ncbi:stevor PIR protein, putative [Plasmodium sp. DRC-Itaito]|nr:stevor PIR protein, putative [Plasmodium sp. DRC-Itaito]